MGGKSQAAPDYSALAAASERSAEIMTGLGREQLDFAKQQYAELKPLAKQVSDAQVAAQQQTMQQGQEYYDYMKSTFRPIEQGLVQRANEFNTDAYREQLASQAAAAAGRAFGTTQAAGMRAAASMGVNPNSGRFAGIQAQGQLGLAAQRAGAMTGARQQAEALGYARQVEAAGLGRNLSGASLGAYSAATGAGSAGLNSAMAPGSQLMQGMASGAATTGQGLNMQMSGLGNILQSQTSVYGANASQSDPLGSIVGMGLGAYAGGAGSALGASMFKK